MNHPRRTVKVRGVEIGAGTPKIIVPITGRTMEQLRAQVAALAGHPIDIVEWRVDFFADLDNLSNVASAGQAIRAQLAASIPILATCRTQAEGGEVGISDAKYGELNLALIESGAADLIDVEYVRDPTVVKHVLDRARAQSIITVASNHDFSGTPARDEIVSRLRAMQELGADICKIAVMPLSPADVLTLLDATRLMYEEYADRPLITVSMGTLGMITRLAGQAFGSAATFALVSGGSAPGQLAAEDVHRVLNLLG